MSTLNIAWILICAALVFLMQAGFLCLESGLVRSKNSINVALKNLCDFGVSSLVFFAVGFGLMFGDSQGGFFGFGRFGLSGTDDPWNLAFFLFQLMFCGTAVTIVSGAVAERTRFWGYLAVAVVISSIIYPVVGHWAWGGILPDSGRGWLAERGFIDFAGSTVVHSVGGWLALAAVLVIGPRTGRFDGVARWNHGHNIPVSMLGVIILWFGWFGFNGGSALALDDSVPRILVNTSLAAASGCIASLVVAQLILGKPGVLQTMNGTIAGLVAITAGCHLATPLGAVLLGALAGPGCFFASRLLERFKVDDAVGAISAHAVAGVLGTLAIPILSDPQTLGNGLNRWQQFEIQALGVGVVFAWSFGLGFAILWCIHRLAPLRVSLEAERSGLNVAEHGETTEISDLLTEMDQHRRSGNFRDPVVADLHTDIGQIAAQYNSIVSRFNRQHELRLEAEQQLLDLNEELEHRVGELANSNRDLEQFAYVASHDLQEPLRMVSSYTQLLATRYKGKLGADADDFISFALDGAQRMKRLIDDLLAYARVGGRDKDLEPTDCERVLERVLSDLRITIQETKACVTHDPLPAVLADKIQLGQVFQNLIGNAVKFHGDRPPRVHISAERREGDWLLSVRDEGIGITPEDSDRAFQIFQRLHPSHGSPGSGIGLSVCRKIVERHGGEIWLESEPGKGSTFYFTLKFCEDTELCARVGSGD